LTLPHPPIPEPQPHPDPDPPQVPESDDPRTQSILLPPSQRQTEQNAEPVQQSFHAPPAEPLSPARPLPGQPVGPPLQDAVPPPDPASGAAPAGAAEPGRPTLSTGPMDFVPGFAGDRPPGASGAGGGAHAAPPRSAGPTTHPGTAVGAPSASPRRSPLAVLQRAGRSGRALPALALAVLGLALLEVGLTLDYDTRSLWDVVPTWSAMATVAALIVLVPAVAGLTGRLPTRTAWRTGAAGVAALAVFWVLVALPLAASDRGFWLTAALACAGAALWLAPGRTE
jgi:hypothetical protein